MTDSQENKVSGYQTVDVVLENNEGVFGTHLPFMGLVTIFRGNLGKILALGQEQGQIRTGAAAEKATIRTSLEEATMKVRNGVRALGIGTQNKKLRDSVNINDSELKGCRDNDMAKYAGMIHKIADGVKTQLGDYLVTAEDIAAVSNLQKQYLAVISDPRYGIILTKDATRNLKRIFRDTDILLREKMDEMILIFKPGNANFVSNYFDARIIVNLGRRKTGSNKITFKGTVKDFETEQAIAGVTVMVIETGQTAVTDAEGRFEIVVEKAGNYNLRVEKDGYKPYTEDTLNAEEGFEYTLDFEIEAEEE
jgi:hypothetical protein